MFALCHSAFGLRVYDAVAFCIWGGARYVGFLWFSQEFPVLEFSRNLQHVRGSVQLFLLPRRGVCVWGGAPMPPGLKLLAMLTLLSKNRSRPQQRSCLLSRTFRCIVHLEDDEDEDEDEIISTRMNSSWNPPMMAHAALRLQY